MSSYSELIIRATGCNPADVAEIEDYMRNIYFHSTLDWQTKAQFDKGAKESYADILWMRSPEGKAYMKQLEKEMGASGVIDETFTEVDLSGFLGDNPDLVPELKKKYNI
jgi:hypothetical protein